MELEETKNLTSSDQKSELTLYRFNSSFNSIGMKGSGMKNNKLGRGNQFQEARNIAKKNSQILKDNPNFWNE